jgi:pimeloyl-ACP methyl ester carboxylesterase
VISGGRGDLAALGSPWDQVEKIWMEHQTKLAQLVPGARHIVDDKSGHQPHLENPKLVVEAIREIVEAARRSGR